MILPDDENQSTASPPNNHIHNQVGIKVITNIPTVVDYGDYSESNHVEQMHSIQRYYHTQHESELHPESEEQIGRHDYHGTNNILVEHSTTTSVVSSDQRLITESTLSSTLSTVVQQSTDQLVDVTIRKISRAILTSSSALLALKDIILRSTHASVSTRTAAVGQLIKDCLLHKDFYFATLNKKENTLKAQIGYLKCFPADSDTVSKMKFIHTLHKYDLDWSQYLASFNNGNPIEFDQISQQPIINVDNNVATKAKFYLSELAQIKFKSSNFYRCFVKYDEKIVLRPRQPVATSFSDTGK
ncbi:unnamed protein product, partial [Didymodactylos carnosus]